MRCVKCGKEIYAGMEYAIIPRGLNWDYECLDCAEGGTDTEEGEAE